MTCDSDIRRDHIETRSPLSVGRRRAAGGDTWPCPRPGLRRCTGRSCGAGSSYTCCYRKALEALEAPPPPLQEEVGENSVVRKTPEEITVSSLALIPSLNYFLPASGSRKAARCRYFSKASSTFTYSHMLKKVVYGGTFPASPPKESGDTLV